MKCSQCSHEIIEGSSFCSHCGTPVSKTSLPLPTALDLPPHSPTASQVKTTVLDSARLVVSANGDGGYRTIHEAIQAAKPGAEILIKAGRYSEVLTIDKPLTLTGEADAQVFIHNADFPVLRVNNTQVILRNLVLGLSQSLTGSILITDSDVQIIACLITQTGSQESEIPLNVLVEKFQDIALKPDAFDPAGNPYQDNQFRGTGKATKITMANSCLTNVTLQVRDEGSLLVTDTAFLRTTIHVSSQAELECKKCRFFAHNDYYKNGTLVLEDCSAKVLECEFTSFCRGVVTARSKVGVVQCNFIGFQPQAPASREEAQWFYDLAMRDAAGSNWSNGDAIINAEAQKDDVFIIETLFKWCRIGVAVGKFHDLTSPSSYFLGLNHISHCEFAENYIGVRMLWNSYPRPKAVNVNIFTSSFHDNQVRAVLMQGDKMDALPSGRIEVSNCKFNANKGTAVEYTGKIQLSGEFNDEILSGCAFKGNSRNLRCSLLFKLNAIWDCAGLGRNPLILGYQIIRRLFRNSGLAILVCFVLSLALPVLGMVGVAICVCHNFGGGWARYSFATGLTLGLISTVGSLWLSSAAAAARKDNLAWQIWGAMGLLMCSQLYQNARPGEQVVALVTTFVIGFFITLLSFQSGVKKAQPDQPQ